MAKIFRKLIKSNKHVMTVPQIDMKTGRKSRRVYTRPYSYEVWVVQVCGFDFHFSGVDEISEYIDWFSKKVHHSTRCSNFGDHWEGQTKFTKLPGFIKSGNRRERVLKALQSAKQKLEKET